VRTSKDKVHRKDLCWSMRVVYVLEKWPDVSGPSLEKVDVTGGRRPAIPDHATVTGKVLEQR
jgi:hypothetical protein